MPMQKTEQQRDDQYVYALLSMGTEIWKKSKKLWSRVLRVRFRFRWMRMKGRHGPNYRTSVAEERNIRSVTGTIRRSRDFQRFSRLRPLKAVWIF